MSIKVGIIGLGVGKSHIESYKKSPYCEVVAIADPDASRLAGVGEMYGIQKRFITGEELIDSGVCDVVSIAVPNKYHKELTIRALTKGMHVLCEKPMAMNALEAQEMLNVAEQCNKRLMIDFSYRFTPQAQALKAKVDAGELGFPYYGRTVWLRRRGMPGFGGWFSTKELSGGGPLIDLGVHRLDLALWFMGYPEPLYVTGATYNPIAQEIASKEKKTFSVEDLAVGFIYFKNGASLSIEASWAANIQENELMETRILGTKGGLLHKNIGETYQFEAHFYTEQNGTLWDQTLHECSLWSAGIQKTPTAMEYFIDAIYHNYPHDGDGKQGLIVMQLLDALYASAQTKKPVYL